MNIDIQTTLGTWIRRSLSPYFFCAKDVEMLVRARRRNATSARLCASHVGRMSAWNMDMPWKCHGNGRWMSMGRTWSGWSLVDRLVDFFGCGLPQCFLGVVRHVWMTTVVFGSRCWWLFLCNFWGKFTNSSPKIFCHHLVNLVESSFSHFMPTSCRSSSRKHQQ